MTPRTCVLPEGRFQMGIHRPRYRAENLRESDNISSLGLDDAGAPIRNRENFPEGPIETTEANPIIEIPNPFPFRGATFIIKTRADQIAENPGSIGLEPPQAFSMSELIRAWRGEGGADDRRPESLDACFRMMPEPLKLAVASNATDPADLKRLADDCCAFVRDPASGRPAGLRYEVNADGRKRPMVASHELMEVIANNPHLPDDYKEVMALRPGAQGDSPIVGEWRSGDSHVFEYLRRNSYIPWGHYAANMAHDAIRYRASALSEADFTGMRHLYYQRVYVETARLAGVPVDARRSRLAPEELERLRVAILAKIKGLGEDGKPEFDATLWGWNFGFDYAPSGYRLHASHQQAHQQYARIPGRIPVFSGKVGEVDGMVRVDGVDSLPTYACGDLVDAFIREYRRETGADFFDRYIAAIRTNARMDGRADRPGSLIVFKDDRVLLFAPKAQTSQWELQLMATGPVGNILEADTATRASLDRAMRVAVQCLEALGARMITTIEFSKRMGVTDTDQRLLYSFLPKLPYSPGSFTEAQLRWINSHYPEDFAAACRGASPLGEAELIHP